MTSDPRRAWRLLFMTAALLSAASCGGPEFEFDPTKPIALGQRDGEPVCPVGFQQRIVRTEEGVIGAPIRQSLRSRRSWS